MWWCSTVPLGSLKRFKDDVREVKEGFECGMALEGYNDLRQGDVIEAYEVRRGRAHALSDGTGCGPAGPGAMRNPVDAA